MKFKIGDKVRANITNPKHAWLLHLSGKEGIIERVFSCANPDKGCYHVSDMEYVMSEEDLELVKPIFNINDYPGRYAMHCKTKEEAKTFLSYLHDMGARWIGDGCLVIENGSVSDPFFYKYDTNSCYSFRNGMVGYGTANATYNDYTILEFEDFDWSDFEMKKKEFTKADLKNGDFVKLRDGSVGITLVDTGAITFGRQYMSLNDLRDDLTNRRDENCDIASVRRPTSPHECLCDIFSCKKGELVYERKEVEEMTLEEVCKALGKEIKIVKK